MAPVMQRQGLTYLRPWLGVDRERILSAARDYTRLTGWEPVHDPTNRDDKYTRAAARERLVSDLDERSQGWQATPLCHGRISAQARDVRDAVAAHERSGLDCSDDSSRFTSQA